MKYLIVAPILAIGPDCGSGVGCARGWGGMALGFGGRWVGEVFPAVNRLVPSGGVRIAGTQSSVRLGAVRERFPAIQQPIPWREPHFPCSILN